MNKYIVHKFDDRCQDGFDPDASDSTQVIATKFLVNGNGDLLFYDKEDIVFSLSKGCWARVEKANEIDMDEVVKKAIGDLIKKKNEAKKQNFQIVTASDERVVINKAISIPEGRLKSEDGRELRVCMWRADIISGEQISIKADLEVSMPKEGE